MTEIYERAYDMLRETQQHSLPINVEQVLSQLGINLRSYSKGKDVLSVLGASDYAHTVQGLSLVYKGVPYIFYNAGLPLEERRKVIIHECAHIYLKHVSSGGIIGKSADPDEESALEREANAFALAALAPAHLLQEYNITDLDDIQSWAQISLMDALAVSINILSHEAPPTPPFDTTLPPPQPSPPPQSLRRLRRCAAAISVVAVLAITLLWGIGHRSPALPSSPTQEPYSQSRLDAPSVIAPDPTPVVPSSPIGGTYYWTQGGEVYHTKEDCFALKQATYPIQSGTLEEAQSYKSRECSFCGK